MIGLAIGLPICFVLVILGLSLPEEISSTAQLDNHNFYVTNEGQIGDMWTTYRLFRCNEKNYECVELYQFAEGGSRSLPINLVVDQNTKEVHIFMGDYFSDLIYTYGELPHENEFQDSVLIEPYHYVIWSYDRNQGKGFLFTKCISPSTITAACEIIPFNYSIPTFTHAKLLEDAKMPTIDLWIDEELIFTYDPEGSRCHAEGCFISKEKY